MLHADFYTPDQRAYLEYYSNQAGGLARFRGGDQYGYGLGAILRGLFRRIVPIGRQVFNIAKPHLKEAGKDIAKAAISKVTEKVLRGDDNQTGSGRKRKQTNIAASSKRITKKQKVVVKPKRNKTDLIPEIF